MPLWPAATSSRWRVGAVLVVAALCLVAAVEFARTTPPITTGGDLAVTELYTALAADGRLLVGPYSRFGWHHPGPLYFYLQAPLYELAGGRTAALYAGALLLNLSTVAVLVWAAARHHPGFAALLVAGLGLFAWRVPRLLASPWTAHVPILPMLAFAVLAASVAAGRTRLLPLAVVFASLAVQSHLALAPATLLAAGVLVLHLVLRRAELPVSPRTIAATLALFAIAWMVPIVEAGTRGGGNLAALWTFFISDPAEARPLLDAFRHWTYGLAGIVRPDLELAWGSRIALDHTSLAIGFALAQVAALAAVTWTAIRARPAGPPELQRRREGLAYGDGRSDSFERHLTLTLLLMTLTALWACTRIRDEVRDHEIFWLAALGVCNLAVITHGSLRPFTTWIRIPSAVAVAGCVLVAALGIAHLRDLTAYERRRPERRVTLLAYDALSRHLLAAGIRHPRLVIDDGVWGETAGVVLRLYRDGTRLSIGDPAGPMFRGLLPASGLEDADVHISRGGRHAELQRRTGNQTILEHHPVFIDVLPLTTGPAR